MAKLPFDIDEMLRDRAGDIVVFTGRNRGKIDRMLPTIAAGNLMTGKAKDKVAAAWMKKTLRQDLQHADMADPQTLNAIIWFACRGDGSRVPPSAGLPAYEAIRLGVLHAGEVVDHKDNDDDR